MNELIFLFLQKLEESKSEVPDWLRQIAKEYGTAQLDMENAQSADGIQLQILMENADDDAKTEVESLFSLPAGKPSTSGPSWFSASTSASTSANGNVNGRAKAASSVKPKTASSNGKGGIGAKSANNSAAGIASQQQNAAVNDWISSDTKW